MSGSASLAAARVAGYDWRAIAGELDSFGCALLPALLSADACRALAALYASCSAFSHAGRYVQRDRAGHCWPR